MHDFQTFENMVALIIILPYYVHINLLLRLRVSQECGQLTANSDDSTKIQLDAGQLRGWATTAYGTILVLQPTCACLQKYILPSINFLFEVAREEMHIQ